MFLTLSVFFPSEISFSDCKTLASFKFCSRFYSNYPHFTYKIAFSSGWLMTLSLLLPSLFSSPIILGWILKDPGKLGIFVIKAVFALSILFLDAFPVTLSWGSCDSSWPHPSPFPFLLLDFEFVPIHHFWLPPVEDDQSCIFSLKKL